MVGKAWKIGFLTAALLGILSSLALGPSPTGYTERFRKDYPLRHLPRDLETFASAEFYDQHFLSWKPTGLSNSEGQLAWAVSYRMAGLNEMFRATGDPRYLSQNLQLARRVLNSTDLTLGLGAAPIWSARKYTDGRPVAHLVHTAMISYPILESLNFPSTPEETRRVLLGRVSEALRYHDEQWREGPAAGEGYFVYTPEQSAERAGQVLPVNRLNAMAKCLWLEWKLSGREESRRRAEAVALYFKNRLKLSSTGSYLWSYELPVGGSREQLPPEDMSHAALTASLVPLLARDGAVFEDSDLVRFAATVQHGVLSDEEGIVFGDVGKGEESDPAQVALPARWLEFAPYHPSIYPKLARYYQQYDRDPNPHRQSLAVALLIRFRPRR